MGMPISVSYDSSAPGFQLNGQVPICLDWTAAPFSARVAVFIPNGSTASYSVEYSLDGFNGEVPPRWYTDGTLGQWQTASGVTNYTSPVQFVRANISALSGTMEMKVLQGLPT